MVAKHVLSKQFIKWWFTLGIESAGKIGWENPNRQVAVYQKTLADLSSDRSISQMLHVTMDYLPTWKVENGHMNKGKWLGNIPVRNK